MLDKRKRVERAFGQVRGLPGLSAVRCSALTRGAGLADVQGRMDTFWDKTMADPAISVTTLTWAGGSGI